MVSLFETRCISIDPKLGVGYCCIDVSSYLFGEITATEISNLPRRAFSRSLRSFTTVVQCFKFTGRWAPRQFLLSFKPVELYQVSTVFLDMSFLPQHCTAVLWHLVPGRSQVESSACNSSTSSGRSNQDLCSGSERSHFSFYPTLNRRQLNNRATAKLILSVEAGIKANWKRSTTTFLLSYNCPCVNRITWTHCISILLSFFFSFLYCVRCCLFSLIVYYSITSRMYSLHVLHCDIGLITTKLTRWKVLSESTYPRESNRRVFWPLLPHPSTDRNETRTWSSLSP